MLVRITIRDNQVVTKLTSAMLKFSIPTCEVVSEVTPNSISSSPVPRTLQVLFIGLYIDVFRLFSPIFMTFSGFT